MQADIEALVLSGELFNGKERSSSPTRSESSADSGWHDEEIQSNPDDEKHKNAGTQESIGMAPGRTGVKGVIRDRDEAVGLERKKKAREMENIRKRMEAENLGGKTYLQEEREKASRGEAQFDDLILKELEKDLMKRDVFGVPRARFGFLREVGVKQFVKAVEQEETGVWVVVHIYDPSLDRCFMLDDLLAHLAKENPMTKFLRARATALEFALVNKPRSKSRPLKRQLRTYKEEDDDFFDDDEDDEDDEDEFDLDDEDVDLEMLPTILVYRDGELVHNWVRVDWVAGEGGVDELLRNHHIIQPSIFAQEDDLIEITHADTEDSGFRVSLNKMLGQSEEYDENGW